MKYRPTKMDLVTKYYDDNEKEYVVLDVVGDAVVVLDEGARQAFIWRMGDASPKYDYIYEEVPFEKHPAVGA